MNPIDKRLERYQVGIKMDHVGEVKAALAAASNEKLAAMEEAADAHPADVPDVRPLIKAEIVKRRNI